MQRRIWRTLIFFDPTSLPTPSIPPFRMWDPSDPFTVGTAAAYALLAAWVVVEKVLC